MTEFVTSIEAKNMLDSPRSFCQAKPNLRRVKFLKNEGSSKFSCIYVNFYRFELFYACLSLLSSHFEGCSGQNQVEPLKMLILNV